MTRAGACLATVAVCALVGALAGCDASTAQFLDAVPISDDGAPEEVEVFLGIDGLSRAAFDRARARGAFRTFSDADLVTPFPGTSDYAWTRTLGAGRLDGYELQHFDPTRNALVNAGLRGVAEHPFREGIAGTLPCYERFDFLGEGDLWMPRSYLDPEGELRRTLDALFDRLVVRARRQRTFLGYLLLVDVLGHKGGLDRAAAVLVELDRRIQAFKARHPGRFRFVLFGDHGNAHVRARLVDPRRILEEVGVAPVTRLGGGGAIEAVPVVHVRVSYVALHTAPDRAAEVAARASRHRDVELAVARLPGREVDGVPHARYGIFSRGRLASFSRRPDGRIRIEDAGPFSALGVLGGPMDGSSMELGDAEAFARTADGPYPDLFHRVATAFEHPAARHPADVLLSLPDDVASYGFRISENVDGVAIDGFHGSLSRAASLSVLAAEQRPLPAAVRSDDLRTMFPALGASRSP